MDFNQMICAVIGMICISVAIFATFKIKLDNDKEKNFLRRALYQATAYMVVREDDFVWMCGDKIAEYEGCTEVSVDLADLELIEFLKEMSEHPRFYDEDDDW